MGVQLSFAFYFTEHPALLRVAFTARLIRAGCFRRIDTFFHALARFALSSQVVGIRDFRHSYSAQFCTDVRDFSSFTEKCGHMRRG